MSKSFFQVVSLIVAASALGLAGCSTHSGTIGKVTRVPFGEADGQQVDLYTLRNARGVEARICNYGGTVISLKVPDKNGQLGDVVLGYDNLEGYLKSSPYFGCLIGRYGNRIAKGKFTLDGETYTLPINNAPNSLHGGTKGFDKVVWDAMPTATMMGPSLELRYVSKDGDQGYPGTLTVMATYTVTDDNELRVDFTATTDKATVVNLTHHSYFNLAGKGDILGHEVEIKSDKFTPVDSTLIPTGELKSLDGSPLDFRKSTAVGARINDTADEQIRFGGGYDHNWVINKPMGKLDLQARVHEPTSGRVMEVWSDQPGLQFYSGNFLDGTITGKGGWVYQKRDGFCMEPQHYPDSPNHPNFPSTVLRPGQTYRCTIIYKFSVK